MLANRGGAVELDEVSLFGEVERNLSGILHLVGTCLVFYALLIAAGSFTRPDPVAGLLRAALPGGAGLIILKLLG